MMYQYCLSFITPAHFGIEGIGQERIDHRVRSDTLWGAIIQQWLLLYNDDPERLCLDSPFMVSSCFPYINGVPFYPLPIGTLDHLITKAGQAEKPEISVKDLRKVRFVAEPLFNEIVNGGTLRFEDLRPDTVFPFDKIEPESVIKRKPIYDIMQRPRMGTDQLSGGSMEGTFFYCSDQYFSQDNGLFFIASFRDNESKKCFDAALRLLGDTGLGADRSIGRGLFVFKNKKYELPDKPELVDYLLLSLYHPTREEVAQGILEAQGAAYTMIKRSGHAASHVVSNFRRYDVWMIEEGSIFTTRPVGDVARVLEKSELIPHNVYRYGQAFCIPIKLKNV